MDFDPFTTAPDAASSRISRRGGRVHLAGTGIQVGPLTDRPEADLLTHCLEAAAAAVRGTAARSIDALYFGTMALQRGREGVDPGHIPGIVRRRLGLSPACALLTMTSTSETGAAVFARAAADIASGQCRNALVLAGEQMFAVGSLDRGDPEGRAHRRLEAEANARVICGVVDPHERTAYGLSMLPVGDLFMDHLAHRSGLAEGTWRAVLEAVTLDKYARSHGHPASFTAARERTRGVLTRAAYRNPERNPFLSHWYTREDVCANACGASAVLLTAAAGPVTVLGVGHGDAPVALGRRMPPLGGPAAIRRALRALGRAAGASPGTLGQSDAALLHDAFPAIELAFLRMLAGPGGWPWVLDRFVGGWGHPFGGLCASGHALGNSGLLQVVQAYDLLTGRLPPQDARRRPQTVLITSVGSALTHVIATLLADADAAAAWLPEPFDPAVWSAPPLPSDDTATMAALQPDEALVVAVTAQEARTSAEGKPGHDVGPESGPEALHVIYRNQDGKPRMGLALAAVRRPAGRVVRIAWVVPATPGEAVATDIAAGRDSMGVLPLVVPRPLWRIVDDVRATPSLRPAIDPAVVQSLVDGLWQGRLRERI